MQIRSSQPRQQMLPAKTSDFSAGDKSYFGPEDGRSQTPRNQKLWKPLLRGVTELTTRVEVDGEENLPTDGPNLYAVTHVTQLDLPIIASLPKQDARTMMTIDAFRNPISGRVATDLGAFPVDRENPSQTTRNHPAEVLAAGNGFVIYPEGTFTEEAANGRVGPLKKGAAAIALSAEAESIIPIAIHYEKSTESKRSEDVAGWIAGATVAAGTMLASLGGPVCRALGGVVSGAVIGAGLGSYGLSRGVENKTFWSPGKRLGAIAGGGAAGAVLGGVAGGFLANSTAPGVSLAMGGLSGLTVRGLNEWWQHRPVAKVKIGEAFHIEDRIENSKLGKSEFSQEASILTEDIHYRLGQLKSDLSGIPYDPEALKIKKGFPELSRLQKFTYASRP